MTECQKGWQDWGLILYKLSHGLPFPFLNCIPAFERKGDLGNKLHNGMEHASRCNNESEKKSMPCSCIINKKSCPNAEGMLAVKGVRRILESGRRKAWLWGLIMAVSPLAC